MLYVPDCNGAEPLSYITPSHYSEWITFFDHNKECFWPIKASSLCHFNEVIAVRESKKLTCEIAEMISSGRMHPDEVELFQCDDNNHHECESTSLLLKVVNYKNNRRLSESDMSDMSDNGFDDSSSFDLEHNTDDDDSHSSLDESNELADILSCISSDTISRIDEHFK
jgi:hypothetical protein